MSNIIKMSGKEVVKNAGVIASNLALGTEQDELLHKLCSELLETDLDLAVNRLQQLDHETRVALASYRNASGIGLARYMIELHLMCVDLIPSDPNNEPLLIEALTAMEVSEVNIYDLKNGYEIDSLSLLELSLTLLSPNPNRGGYGDKTLAHIATRISDINVCTTINNTGRLKLNILMRAIMTGDLSASRTLLECGADLDAVNNVGESARTYVEEKRNSDPDFYFNMKALILAHEHKNELTSKPKLKL